MKCKVIKSFSRVSSTEGLQVFHQDDLVDLPADDAQGMAEAGIVEILEKTKAGAPETAEMQVPGVEKAVKPAPKKGA